MRKMRTPSSDARFSFNDEPVNIIPLSETTKIPTVSDENVLNVATKPIDTVRVRKEQAQIVSAAEQKRKEEEERRRNRELIDREAAKAVKKPEQGKKGKKNSKMHRVMDVLYKVAAVVLILGSVAMTVATVNLLRKSNEPDIKYLYHYNGTSGYEAPEGVTVNQPEDVKISQPDQTAESDSAESSSTDETASSADYRVVDGERLQSGLYFDVDDE